MSEVESGLLQLLLGVLRGEDADFLDEEVDVRPSILEVSTFRDAGIMTSNPGLVVEHDDGSELQISIVLSRASR